MSTRIICCVCQFWQLAQSTDSCQYQIDDAGVYYGIIQPLFCAASLIPTLSTAMRGALEAVYAPVHMLQLLMWS